MIYFTHQELAATYHVSVKTVRNWIESAKEGKLVLALHETNGRSYISNTASNIAQIEQLAEKGKKYRPHRAVKVVTPRVEFYNLYNQAQIYDIIMNLDIHKEIPRQYNYFDKGADYWDDYVQRLSAEKMTNTLTSTIHLLEINQTYLDDLLKEYDRINIIDIGPGNALPVRKLLEHYMAQGKLGKYIGLDISQQMLHIAGSNIKRWFADKVDVELHQIDITFERFTNLVAEMELRKTDKKEVNVVLFFGATAGNLKEPYGALKTIHDSMARNDVLLQAQKLDSKNARRYFDFNLKTGNVDLAPNHRFIFDLLNIDKSYYDVEMGFDEVLRERYIRVRFKLTVTINFVFASAEKTIEVNKDDTILLWRSRHYTDLEFLQLLDSCDFHTLHASQTDDWEYILTAAQIKRS